MNSVPFKVKRFIVASAFLCALVASCTSTKDAASESDAPKLASTNQQRDSVVVVINAATSATVFDLLNTSHVVDYQASALGVFVRGIDSVYSTTNAFWIYSVNDTLPDIAADKFTVRPGDIVRWHLRKSAD